MNGGSKRLSISNSVSTVEILTSQGEKSIINRDECNFGYRSSIFLKSNFLIVGINLIFSHGPGKDVIARDMAKIRLDRRLKFPYDKPNCGSVFKSSPNLYNSFGTPGHIIQSLGLCGFRVGQAVVSSKHGNFFENLGSAKACDMISLICKIRKIVFLNTGINMNTEVRFVSQNCEVHSIDQLC